ncbi:MAG TPA: WD40 repeat domain-containing protein [Catalimonadaceae bacterium]|nr:WD40 repeat domain-containing protein [Catalimonadaceae bacterium]
MRTCFIFFFSTFCLIQIGFGQLKIDTSYTIKGHENGISSLAFSPNKPFLVSGSQDETIRIWDFQKGKEMKVIKKQGSAPTSLLFSPDGMLLHLGKYEKLITYSTTSWKKKGSLSLFPGFIENLAINAPKTVLAASSWKEKSLVLLDYPSLTNERVLKETEWTDAISFSSDGKYLVTGSHSNTLKIWNVALAQIENEFTSHTDWIYGCFFIDSNQKIISTGLDKSIALTEVKTGRVIQKIENAHSDGISYALLSRNGKYLITGSLDKKVKIWSTENLQLLQSYDGSEGKIITMALSEDGKWLAIGGSDKLIHLLRISYQ